jgi:YVTN family beta-propeller protein/VCBS repeat-containing protein
MATSKNRVRRQKGRHRKQQREADVYAQWLGAGAVALGLGAAMATGQGVAQAAPDDGASSASDSSGATSSPSASGDTKPSAPASASSVSPKTGTGTNDSRPATSSTVKESVSATPSMKTADTDDDSAARDKADPAEPAPSQPAASETAVPAPTTEPAVVEEPPIVAPPASDSEVTAATGSAPVRNTGSDKPTHETPADVRAVNAHPTVPSTAADVDAPSARPSTDIAKTLAPISSSPTTERATTSVAPESVPAVTYTAQPVSVAAVGVPIQPSGIVSGLLALIGLVPTAANGTPAAPVQSTGLWAVLEFVRRQLFNQTPTAVPVQTGQSTTGVVTGTVGAVDPDDDPLVYTVTQYPANGSVVVNPDGSYVYTPSAALAATGGADTFTVLVDDNTNFHLHLFGGIGRISVPVSVVVTKVNVAPGVTAPPSAGTPDATTGAVAGSLNVVDRNGDPLTYTVTTAPGKGQVGVDAAGNYTYTPTSAARIQAAGVNAAPADKQDTFTVTVSDGQLSTTVEVTVRVTGPNNTVIATIPIGDYAGRVAVSPDGTRAYVVRFFPDASTSEVLVIDTVTNTVISHIEAGAAPRDLALSPDGRVAFVSNSGSADEPDHLAMIDTVTGEIIGTIPIDGPGAVAVSPDGSKVYVATGFNGVSDGIAVIDTTTNAVTTIPLGADPNGIILSPNGSRLYVASITGHYMTVIDTASNTVISSFHVSGGPDFVAVTPDGTRLYVTNIDNGTVTVVDTASDTITATIPVSDRTIGAVVSPDGARLYVTNYDNGTVSVINTADNAVVATIPVATTPLLAAISPDGTHLYVTHLVNSTVSVIYVDPTVPLTNSVPPASAPLTVGSL